MVDAKKGTESEAGASPRRRRGKAEARAHLVAGAVLSTLIVLMVNYLAFRHFHRFDWTSERLFSVSDRTVAVLRELETPIDIYLFMSDDEPNYADVQELLNTYRSHSDKVQVRAIDPHRRAAEYRVLAQRFNLATLTGQDGSAASDVAAVVVAGERTWKITRDDLLTFNFQEGGAQSVDVEAERALTGAIVEATSGRSTQVCVTSGHGEWDLSSSGERGLAGMRELLDRDNVRLRGISTLGGRDVPEDCDAVYVIGPERAFGEDEVAALDRYLSTGGDVLLALDPVFEAERVRPTGFEAMLRARGVELDPTVVLELDPAMLLSSSPVEAFIVSDFGEHETTSRLRLMGIPMVVHVARSVRPTRDSEAAVLFQTSARGYAKRDLGELATDAELAPSSDDLRGPVPLAVALEIEVEASPDGSDQGDSGVGRLIVVGDSDWLTGDFLAHPRFVNMDLIGAFTGWLAHRSALIEIAPRTSDVAAVVMTEGDLQNVMIRVFLLMPLAVFLLGLSVWWSRKA